MTTMHRNTDSRLPYERRPLEDYRAPFEFYERRWSRVASVAFVALAGAAAWTAIVIFAVTLMAILHG
jgi:hypothetical protein